MNRTQRRAYDREAKELDKYAERSLDWIEPAFKDVLFDEACDLSYLSIFRTFDAKWRNASDAWNKSHSLIEIDRNYFFNTYKPLENLKPKR